MKKLKFHPDLIPLVLNGSKTTTWRLFDDKYLQVADKLFLLNSKTEEKFAQAEIVEVVEKSFKNLTDDDWVGHEKFSSNQEMYKTYSRYYGCEVNENTILKIIKFKLK